MQSPNRIITLFGILGMSLSFGRGAYADDLKMFISAYCWTEEPVTGIVKRTVFQNMQSVDQPCWSGMMDVKIGWMSIGYGTLYPYYMRHEKFIEEPAVGAAPFS